MDNHLDVNRAALDRLATRTLSRRSFLVASGGTAIAVAFGDIAPGFAAESSDGFAANAWVTIGSDGMITIMQPASEMGQGAMTVMPMMIADELDADWQKLRIIPSPDNAAIYGNPVWNGDLTTFGSGTVRGYWEKARLAGAQARKVLLLTAADQWQLPIAELSTENGEVVHKKSGKRAFYGELAAKAKVPDPLPEATKDDLKPAAAYRYIGHDLPRVDVPLKVNGAAKFGIDTVLPNMLYAAVLYPPVEGETVIRVDDSAARAVKDIVAITPTPFGVAVIGKTVESTRKAKALLAATWTTNALGRNYTTADAAQDYLAIARDPKKTGVAMFKIGDVAAAMPGAVKTIVAEYTNDHVSHMPMEPTNATAIVNGSKCEIWASNQSPSQLKRMVGRTIGIPPDNVTIHTPYLGGGFGRRSEGDDAAQAAALAKLVPGTPIKLIRSREDDISTDFFRAMTAARIEVGLDASGKIIAWHHRVVAPSAIARSLPPQIFNDKLGGKDGIVAGFQDIGYPMPNRLIEYIREERGKSVGAWRGTWSGYHYFAVETMIDVLAAATHTDPVAYRLALMKDDPRAVKVIETAAHMAGWGRHKPAAGHALGAAYTNYGGAHQSIVAEVALDKASGAIKVHHLWAAFDPGRAVHPANAVYQMEGAMMFGLSAALYEHVDLVKGEVQETNFDKYRVLRMADVPPVEIKLIQTDNPPSGMGEPGVPGVAPAIANAIATLTGGKRLRQLPMLPARVKATIAA
jgi:isoquinoline 1-oxidoreductase subunit beta